MYCGDLKENKSTLHELLLLFSFHLNSSGDFVKKINGKNKTFLLVNKSERKEATSFDLKKQLDHILNEKIY